MRKNHHSIKQLITFLRKCSHRLNCTMKLKFQFCFYKDGFNPMLLINDIF